MYYGIYKYIQYVESMMYSSVVSLTSTVTFTTKNGCRARLQAYATDCLLYTLFLTCEPTANTGFQVRNNLRLLTFAASNTFPHFIPSASRITTQGETLGNVHHVCVQKELFFFVTNLVL